MLGTHATFGIYLQKMLAELTPPGVDISEELSELLQGFTTKPLVDQHAAALRLFEIMAALPMAHELAFQLGAQIPLTAYAPLAIPMKLAPTLRQSIEFIATYAHLQAPLIAINYKDLEEAGLAGFDFRLPASDEVEAFLCAGAFSALNIELSRVTGNNHNFQSIQLKTCPDGHIPLYKKYLGVSPEQGAEHNTVVISDKVLNTPNPFADPASFESYSQDYAEQLKTSMVAGELSEQARQIIAAHISEPPNLQELASQLNLSDRQFRFALKKENTNYRELLMQCRVDFSRIQLANPRMSISLLAQKLGYQDVSAFNHGFKRWTGKSPSEFQKDLLSK
ncbi:MAG: helix-turn-helix domain-containing protein [Spongiibacteraceae bacterium]